MTDTAPRTIDLLIEGCQVVTMNDARDIIRDGAVAVDGDAIIEVGKAADVMAYARIDRLLSSLREQDCLLVLGDVGGRCQNPIDPDGDPLPLAAVVDGWLQLAYVPQPFLSERRAA